MSWSIGCHSPDVVEVPAVAFSESIYTADVLEQKSSDSIDESFQLFSQEISSEKLHFISMQYGYKFHEPWKYMGTKNGEHYLMLYPFLRFREIYRISEEAYSIEEPFELTSQPSKWRAIESLIHYGMKIPLVIEAPLFEEPIGIMPAQSEVFGSSLEDQFMKKAQILTVDSF